MASASGRLTFVLDANSGGLLPLLRAARVVRHEALTDLEELGFPAGALDPEILADLGARGGHVLVTRDGAMLTPLTQRGAWREAGLMLFLLGKRWGELPLSELTRRVMFLWPTIVEIAETGGPGAAWRVSPTVPVVPSASFRPVTGLHAG